MFDAHALSGTANEAKEMLPWLVWAKRTDSSPHVSTATLAETTDGSPRDANLRRVIKAFNLEPVTEEIGYTAGRIRASAARSRKKTRDLTIDALVAATAMSLRPPVLVLTSDTADLELLLQGTGITVKSIGKD